MEYEFSNPLNIFVLEYLLNLFSFITQERQLATDVVNILEASKAVDYIPVFARHRMTPELILDMKDEELRQVRAPMYHENLDCHITFFNFKYSIGFH
jgi:hypothetical protein